MKTPRTAITIYSLHPYCRDGRMSVVDFIEYAARIGAGGVDLGYFWQDEEREAEEASARIRDLGLTLSGYIVGNNFALADDPERRKAEIDKVKHAVDRAADMGAPNLRVFAGAARERVTWEAGRVWVAECFAEATEYAASRGIKIALEDHHGLAASADHLLWYKEQVPDDHFGFNVDIGNFVFAGDNCLESCRRTAPYAVHVHVKDFVLAEHQPPAGCSVGDGDIDAAACIAAVAETGYDGFYSIEFEGAEDAKVGVEKSLRFLENALRRAEA
jgi:sugar phosphate isomerase/epimerase